MVEARARGYFGIGAEGVSKSANIGALLRTGHAFGASFCFTIGTGWDSRAARTADTADTPSHVPMWRYPTLADMSLPRGCALVGIELLDDAVDLPSFRHPLNAAYVFGTGTSGIVGRVAEAVRPCGANSHPIRPKLAVAGALVLDNRLLQYGRFAERPVGSRGAIETLPATGHGPPRFRKTIPDWLDADAKKP